MAQFYFKVKSAGNTFAHTTAEVGANQCCGVAAKQLELFQNHYALLRPRSGMAAALGRMGMKLNSLCPEWSGLELAVF